MTLQSTKNVRDLSPILSLLKADAVIFWSDYGSKAVTETWVQRLNKQIKNADQVKDFTNINIATGREALVCDTDLDCVEANKLADYFLPRTEMEFGRESTPRAHRLYKVIDLTQKNTREFCSFTDKKKSVIVEIRANKHYTMCWGQYDNGENVVWTKSGNPTEVSWEALNKAIALLSVASVILRKFPAAGKHDDYIRFMVNTLWHHKIEQSDCLKIIEAVIKQAGCSNCYYDNEVAADKLAKIDATYSKERTVQLYGLPKLAEEFNWNEDEVKDFKKLMFKITGRDSLPEYTSTFVQRIAYMMKQKQYYDIDDKEMYDGESIDIKYAKFFNGKYTPLKYWKMSKDSRVCVDFTYQPGDPNRFVHVNKKLMINVFEKNELKPDIHADTDYFWALI
ncbi:MAG: hypothetical protein O2871_04055, partial [bacterium]|nr:hypothetical protein [bacterium]